MALVVYNAKSPHVEELKRAPERTFSLGNHLITMRQRWKPGGQGGTALGHGASVYDAAFVLSDYLFRLPVDLAQKKVVELGSGPGLGAIAAALCGASEVVATDGDQDLLSLTRENLDLNLCEQEVRSRCRTAPLLWGDAAAANALGPAFDCILVADCAAVVYASAFDALVSSLVTLSDENTRVILSYHRRHKSEGAFFSRARVHFSIERVSPDSIHPDFLDSEISVFEMTLLKKDISSENSR